MIWIKENSCSFQTAFLLHLLLPSVWCIVNLKKKNKALHIAWYIALRMNIAHAQTHEIVSLYKMFLLISKDASHCYMTMNRYFNVVVVAKQ